MISKQCTERKSTQVSIETQGRDMAQKWSTIRVPNTMSAGCRDKCTLFTCTSKDKANNTFLVVKHAPAPKHNLIYICRVGNRRVTFGFCSFSSLCHLSPPVTLLLTPMRTLMCGNNGCLTPLRAAVEQSVHL